MPSTELSSQHGIDKKPSSRKNSTAAIPKQSARFESPVTSGPRPPLVVTRSDIATGT